MKLEYMFQITWPPEGKESHRVLLNTSNPRREVDSDHLNACMVGPLAI